MKNQNKIIIKKQQDIHDHYWNLSQFLSQFAADADFDIFDDEYTIKISYEFCERDYQDYLKIQSQANEILAMEPFPYDAIEESTNLLISEATDKNQKSEEVKKWLRHVLHLLELRVTGKL